MNAAHSINPDDYEATLIFPSLLLSVHTASLPLSSQRPQQIAQNFHILGKSPPSPQRCRWSSMLAPIFSTRLCSSASTHVCTWANLTHDHFAVMQANSLHQLV